MITLADRHLRMASTLSDLLRSKAPFALSFGTTSSIPPCLAQRALLLICLGLLFAPLIEGGGFPVVDALLDMIGNLTEATPR